MNATEIVNGVTRNGNGRPIVTHEVLEFNRLQLKETLEMANQEVSAILREVRDTIHNAEASIHLEESLNFVVEADKVVVSISRSFDLKKDAPVR